MIDHDATGNLIADKDGYLYDYDGENRVVRISRGDGDRMKFPPPYLL